MVDVVILTALTLEFKSVSERLMGRTERQTSSHTIYEVGTFGAESTDISVAVGELGPGDISAAAETSIAIAEFKPNLVLFVGVAGGIKDVSIGDVVVASKVYAYESGKEEPSGFRPRPDLGISAWAVEQEAKSVARLGQWHADEEAGGSATSPKAMVAPICAGEKVIASRRSPTYKFIRNTYGDAVAVEMEGRGFLEPARHFEVRAGVVRGISDLIDRKSMSDAQGTQIIAAQHAAEFALHLALSLKRRQGASRGTATAASNPYRGLRYFDVLDAPYFFGRDGETENVLLMLHERITKVRPRIVGIVGASGSGKSSIARAGVIAALRAEALQGSDQWKLAVLRPGPNPLGSLAEMLASQGVDNHAVQEFLASSVTDDRSLDTLIESLDASRIVIFVDQLEELFTLCSDSENSRSFLRNIIYAACRNDGKAVLLFTLRSDQYQRCADLSEFATLVSSNHLLIGAMNDGDLESAITAPALRSGRTFESGLVARILRDCHQLANPLPLLQYALSELWKRAPGTHLRHHEYDEVGGLAGAMIERAESAYLGLKVEQKAACRILFLRMSLNEGTIDARQPMQLSELVPEGEPERPYREVVDLFAGPSLRLLVLDESESGDPVVELMHESLLLNWPRLRAWLDADRGAHAYFSQLARDARAWRTNGKPSHQLMTSARLKQASDWLGATTPLMSRTDREFLDASLSAQVTRLLDAPESRVAVELAEFQEAGTLIAEFARKLLVEVMPASSTRRLRLALLTEDAEQITSLREDLLLVAPGEFCVLIEAMGARAAELEDFMWAVVHSEKTDSSKFVRACAALGKVGPGSPAWGGLAQRLIAAVIDEGPVAASQWFVVLKPLAQALLNPLRAIAQDGDLDDSIRTIAATGIVAICDVSDVLANIMIDCTAGAHQTIFLALKGLPDVEKAVARLTEASYQPCVEQDLARVIRRATAMADLMRLGGKLDGDEALSDSCPEGVASHFAKLASDLDVSFEDLWNVYLAAASVTARRRLLMALTSVPRTRIGESVWLVAREHMEALSRTHQTSSLRALSDYALSTWRGRQSGVIDGITEQELSESDESFRLSFEGLALTFVKFDAGEFLMGSPDDEYLREEDETQHTVRITRPFVLLDRPVTGRLFEHYLKSCNANWSARDSMAEAAQTYVSWVEAVAFAAWLTAAFDGLSGSKVQSGFRLPTEAEWEYACRAGTTTTFSFGNGLELLPRYGWFVDHAGGRPHPPAELLPNPRGLFDMHGNVYEWCNDWYGVYEQGDASNPTGPVSGDRRVVRGGCWFFESRFCRSAYRGNTREPHLRFNDIGFRLACDWDSFLVLMKGA